MESYQEAKKWMTIRTLGLAAIAGSILICILFVVVTYLILTYVPQ